MKCINALRKHTMEFIKGQVRIDNIHHTPNGPALLVVTDAEDMSTRFGNKPDRTITVRVYVMNSDGESARYLETTKRWIGGQAGRATGKLTSLDDINADVITMDMIAR